MSVETWVEERIPGAVFDGYTWIVPEEMVVGKTDPELLGMTLLKWEGLLPENLGKHGIKLEIRPLIHRYQSKPRAYFYDDGKYLHIGGANCHLCVKDDWCGDGACHGCPLNGEGADCLETFSRFKQNGDPTEMIGLIRWAMGD